MWTSHIFIVFCNIITFITMTSLFLIFFIFTSFIFILVTYCYKLGYICFSLHFLSCPPISSLSPSKTLPTFSCHSSVSSQSLLYKHNYPYPSCTSLSFVCWTTLKELVWVVSRCTTAVSLCYKSHLTQKNGNKYNCEQGRLLIFDHLTSGTL